MPIEVKNLTHTYMEGTPFEAHALKDGELERPRWRVHRRDRPYRAAARAR